MFKQSEKAIGKRWEELERKLGGLFVFYLGSNNIWSNLQVFWGLYVYNERLKYSNTSQRNSKILAGILNSLTLKNYYDIVHYLKMDTRVFYYISSLERFQFRLIFDFVFLNASINLLWIEFWRRILKSLIKKSVVKMYVKNCVILMLLAQRDTNGFETNIEKKYLHVLTKSLFL